MRDVMLAATGTILGGVLGIGVTLLTELVLVGVVVGTLMFARPTPMDLPFAQTTVVGTTKAAPETASAGPVGELQLMTTAAVQPQVDGVPMCFDPAQGFLMTLPPGAHRIVLVDLLLRPVATSDVTVVAGQRTQLRWSKKVLSDLGRVPMLMGAVATSAAVPMPTVVVDAPVAAVVEQAAVDIEAAMADVQAEIDAVEAASAGVLSLGTRAGSLQINLPRLGKRTSR